MKENNIDCMKYRKSTHLAGIDVEAIISDKGKCVLTIKEAYYATGIDVSGNKTDGYFLEFVEDFKPMVVNSINRKTISAIVKELKQCTPAESRNIGNWVGLQIELDFDPSVKMMGKVVGGIRIKPTQLAPKKKQITDEGFEKALAAVKAGQYTAEKIKETYILTQEQIAQL